MQPLALEDDGEATGSLDPEAVDEVGSVYGHLRA